MDLLGPKTLSRMENIFRAFSLFLNFVASLINLKMFCCESQFPTAQAYGQSHSLEFGKLCRLFFTHHIWIIMIQCARPVARHARPTQICILVQDISVYFPRGSNNNIKPSLEDLASLCWASAVQLLSCSVHDSALILCVNAILYVTSDVFIWL